MAERVSWAVMHAGGVVGVEEGRLAMGALWTPGGAFAAKTGFRPATNPGVVTASGTADAFVHVAPFQAVLQTSRAAAGGAYIMTLDATKDVNILSTPANATNPRNDLIIAQQSDEFYGDGTYTWAIRQVVGTPAGSPVDPAVSGSPDYIPLARVRVDANVTTITAAKITDLRPGDRWSVALGGILPVASQAVRDGLAGKYEGMTVWRLDQGWAETYITSGTQWRVQGVASVTSTAGLSAITHPYQGQLAVNTGEGLVGVILRYDSGTSSWRRTTPYRVKQVLAAPAASVVFSSIPTNLHHLKITWTARDSDTGFNANIMKLRVNADAGNNYYYQFLQSANAAVTSTPANAVAFYHAGLLASATAAANVFANGEIEIVGWDGPHPNSLGIMHRSDLFDAGITTSWFTTGGGKYGPTGPYTSITLLPELGNFVAGSEFTITGWE